MERINRRTSSINVNWTSDGSIITFEIPDQALTVTEPLSLEKLLQLLGTMLRKQQSIQPQPMMKTVMNSRAFTEVGSLFNEGENTGSSIADFIQNNGHYTLKVDLEGANSKM